MYHCNSQTLRWSASSLPNNELYWRCLSNITVSSLWTKCYKNSIEILRQARPPLCIYLSLRHITVGVTKPPKPLPLLFAYCKLNGGDHECLEMRLNHTCTTLWYHYARSLNERQLYEEQLHKEMVLLGSLTNFWIRPAAWMHFVHDMAVPISRSPQHSWWGLVLAGMCLE